MIPARHASRLDPMDALRDEYDVSWFVVASEDIGK
jgi:hypothetical protein